MTYWLLLLAGCSGGEQPERCAPDAGCDTVDGDTEDCGSGTDPGSCDEDEVDTEIDTEADTADTDTEWDTEPLLEGTDVEIDTELCEPTEMPEQVAYGPGGGGGRYDWCVRPQSRCVTWSQVHARSRTQCFRTSTLTQCDAATLAITRLGYEEDRQYFDTDGVLIAAASTSDTNLACPSDTDPTATVLTVWDGARVEGCTAVESAYSAGCLPVRAIAWTEAGTRPPTGPATLDAAREGFAGGCHGEASCGTGRGTIVIAPAFDDDGEERFEYWYYGSDGSLQASHGEFLVSGTTPGRCQGAVVQQVGNCGVVHP